MFDYSRSDGKARKYQKKEKMDVSKLKATDDMKIPKQNYHDEEDSLLEVKNREEVLDHQSQPKKAAKKNKNPFRFMSRIRSRPTSEV